jgi:hypothetical protein
MLSRRVVLAWCTLAAALACTRSHACRDGTLFLTVHLEDASRGAARLEVDVAVDDGAPKAEGSFTIKAGDTAPSLEISFPTYSQIHALRVDVRAYAAGRADPIATASQTTSPLPAGCLALPITLSGSDGDGGGGAGGADGVDGSAGSGGAGGSTGGCLPCTVDQSSLDQCCLG